MTAITIVNRSTVLTDAEILAVIGPVGTYVNRDVCPAWGLEPVALSFIGSASGFAGSGWPLYVMDSADLPGALGYHEDPSGVVEGKLFAGDCQRDGVSWTVDLTHELVEMIVDPQCDTTITLPDGRQTIREACDAVEDDAESYMVDGVQVSDFVLPSYFSQGPGPWDFQRRLSGPAPAMATGGYLSILSGGQWTQVFAMRADGSISDRAGRRGRSAWRVARKSAP